MPLYDSSIIIPIYGVFLGVAILLTCLRFLVRSTVSREPYSRNPFGLDDFFVSVGLIIVSTCSAIQFYNSIHGNGGKATSKSTSAHEAIVEYKIDFAMLVIEKPAFGAIKLSLLFFYRRIFGHWPSFQRLNNCLIGVIVLWATTFMLADVFLCGVHPQYHWILDQVPNRGRCGDKGLLLILFGVSSVVTDALVVGLPLLYIRRLRMRRGKRVAACAVFLLGGVSTLAGLFRTIFLCVAYPLGRLTWGYISPPDATLPLTLKIIQPTFWVMIEMLLGLWAANLPTLAPLVRSVNNYYRGIGVYRKFSRSDFSDAEQQKTSVHIAQVKPIEYISYVRNDSVTLVDHSAPM